MDLTLKVLKQWKIPTPQLLITGVGSGIHYGRHLVQDKGWEDHINHRWKPDEIRKAMIELPGLRPQPPHGQGPYKISYDADSDRMPTVEEIRRHLRRSRMQAQVIFSHNAYLDIIPIRASKGMALRYFAPKWAIPIERCLVAGDSGNDEELMTGNTLGVVVGNYSPELEKLRGQPRVYFAEAHYARGIIEGIEHYDFLGRIRIPEQEQSEDE